jgi:signal transduction histidine kinase/ActR/RegA family two-component response regulator
MSKASRWAALFGLYALVGGLVSFAGWAADIPRLTDWDSDGISIQPNATIAASSAGGAVILLAVGHHGFAAVLGAIVAFIGGTTIFQYVSGINLGVDTLFLFDRMWGRVGVLFPGRMGPPGAASWTIIGTAILLAALSRYFTERLRALVPMLSLATLAISSLSLIGYLYGANLLYTIPTSTVIAIQTSSFIFAVSLGLLMSVPEYAPARLLYDEGAGGAVVRRILPAIVVMPLVLGMLRLAGQRAGLYDVEFGTAVRTLIEMALLFGLLWWTADSINRQARRRQEAETRVTEQEFLLRAAERRTLDTLASDLADSRTLQRVSAEIIHEDDVQSLYGKIVSAAATIMHAECASLQMIGERGELNLLAAQGFPPEAAEFWDTVQSSSPTASGIAIRTGARAVIEDVTAVDALRGTDDLQMYLASGIRAVQATPLVSRKGRLLGTIATHWDRPHAPTERELRLFDILARQAADLIERREAEHALVAADRRKDEFLATLAHELRNPLAPMRTAVELMKLTPAPHPDVAWARDVIGRQVELMARLLDDLLDVSRIVGDKLELRQQRMDLSTAIQAAVEQCRPLLDAFRHQLDVNVPAETTYVEGDAVRLGQVFGNLLNNACKYTRPGGRIQIDAAGEGDTVRVTVRDTGIGIPREQLSRVFDLFSQVDPSISHSHGGLGIGLYLVRRLVEMHGGAVEATSEGPDRGSAFVVRLPAIPPPPAVLLAPTVRPLQTNAGRRVLIVDDNVDAASALALLLEASGNETHVAHDGFEAVKAAESLRPEVIVLDIGLPRMDGFEVCRRIRQQPWAKAATLIALTGWGQAGDRQKSQEAGFDHHLVKPVEQSVLLNLLQQPTTRPSGEPLVEGH